MYYIGIAINLLVAFCMIIFAYSISKGNIKLIHQYHVKNVREEERNDYLQLFSKGLYIIGFGCLISAIFFIFENTKLMTLSIFLGLIFGIFIIGKAQKRYNGGWFA